MVPESSMKHRDAWLSGRSACRLLILTAALLSFRSPAISAQGITQVTTQNVAVAMQITVNYQGVPAGYWIGVSIKAPNGRVVDLRPSQVGGSGSVSFRTTDPPCDYRRLRGYSIAAALWRGYQNGQMTGLVSRFMGTTWIPLSCPKMYGI